ncbi:MAG: hypothetical protein JST83_00435 [Bacteroidetes bacterium]|nr:hypothetical protein [Bacteroidota bacterium]
MKKTAFACLALCLLFASCKKDNSSTNGSYPQYDAATCSDHTNLTVAELHAYMGDCHKVWRVYNIAGDSLLSPVLNAYWITETANGQQLGGQGALHYNPGSATSLNRNFYNGGGVITMLNGHAYFCVSNTSAGTGDPYNFCDMDIIDKSSCRVYWVDTATQQRTPLGMWRVYTDPLPADFNYPNYDQDHPSGSGNGNGNGNGNGGGNSSVCTGSYSSPSSDGQLDAYCHAAYVYRCVNGAPLSDPSVQSVCDAYNQLKPAGTPPCPYCH